MSVDAHPDTSTSGAPGVPGTALAPHARRAGRARGGAALGTSLTEFHPRQQEARRERYRRRSAGQEWLIRRERQLAGLPPVAPKVVDPVTGEERRARAGDEEWVRPPRLARCSWRVGEVGVHAHDDGSGPGHFSGTERCGSIWGCPVCASVIRPKRASEIQHAVGKHTEKGGSLLFVTLTLRHHKGQPLAETLDAVLTCWQKMLRGKAWGTTKDRYGITGYIRSIEITLGENGWHPHAHVIMFLTDAISAESAEILGDELHGRWSRYALAATGRMPTRRAGVDVQRVTGDGKVIAQYLGKLQDDKTANWDVGAEMSRSDVKRGRGSGSMVPFELLDKVDPEDEPNSYERWEIEDERRRLWVEYAEATKGRRAITWSRGLKKMYGVKERSDADIMKKTESAPLRYVVDGPAYDRARKDGALTLALVLEAAESGDWDAVEQLLPGGHLKLAVRGVPARDPIARSAFPRPR